jgi:hypothetical protein
VHVEQHHVGGSLNDHLDGRLHLAGFADHGATRCQLGLHALAEEVMVIHEKHSYGGFGL